jgi:hypothetical protein
MASLPSLGRRGEGWVALQLGSLGAVVCLLAPAGHDLTGHPGRVSPGSPPTD